MNYSAFITDFLRAAHLPRISAQEPLPDQDLIQQVTAAKEKEIAPATGPTASCIRSLLFLAAGGLSQAHRIVQAMSTTDAAHIHGVIHRVDDDFDNARYWFRGARVHPAAAEMYRRASASSPTMSQSAGWDPILVTDLLEKSRSSGVSEELQTLLTIEFEELLRFLWSA
ncbi:MAG: hypothetical protein QOI53_499 [Verrucomicrobiota bacterium]|nr:hypothetical protein [Verrucomicrobiota bacterium]